MLVMFRAKNFSSFHNEIILDMRATVYKEHPSHIIPHNDFSLLKTVAIYGANASGKSNLITALFWFEQYIFNQFFKDTKETEDEKAFIEKKFPIKPFLLVDPINDFIEFEMVFFHNDFLYQYGFSFDKSIIHTEWLYCNKELVYDRKTSTQIEYGRKYKELLKDYKKFREDRLYLSILDYFATDKIKVLIDSFKNYFMTRFNIFFDLFLTSTVKGTFNFMGSLPNENIENEAFRSKVTEYLKNIDVGIIDLVIEKKKMTNSKTGVSNKLPIIKTVHGIYDSKGIKIGTKKFDLNQESEGTQRFLSFIQEILIMLENGGVFIVDELSARLHPLLTKFIIELFQSDVNSNNAQLIFTTHDTSILNKEQFRRDEILFVDKNEKGESSVYSLSDLKTVRQDATYNKDYFNGKYGAIPIIQSSQNKNGGA